MSRNDPRILSFRKRIRHSDCADPARLAAFVDQKLGEEDQDAVKRHVLRCDDCFEAVSQLLSLKGKTLPELPAYLSRHALRVGKGQPGTVGIRGWKWAGALAALAASLLVGAGIWVIQSPLDELPGQNRETRALRGGAEEDGKLVLLFPSEGARLVPGRVRFSWQAVPGAVAYGIRLVDESGALVWSTRVATGTGTHPESELAAGDYFVSVRALLPDGTAVTSDFVRFSVTP